MFKNEIILFHMENIFNCNIDIFTNVLIHCAFLKSKVIFYEKSKCTFFWGGCTIKKHHTSLLTYSFVQKKMTQINKTLFSDTVS